MLPLNFFNSVFIVDAGRSAIANAYKSFKHCAPAQLAAFIIKDLVKRNKIERQWIDELILGNVVSAGLGQNIARQAALLAGLPESIEAYTLNNVCGSGLQSIICAQRALLSNQANLILAGGVESVTQSPFLVRRDDVDKKKFDRCVDSSLNDGLLCSLTEKSMGELMELTARKYKISREEQDLYSLNSHRKAVKAQEEGWLAKEIIPVKLTEKQVVSKDDRPRKNLQMENFRELPPAFAKDGSVTAGNASSPCDGAAAVLLASSQGVRKYKLKPKARLLGYSSIGLEPELVFEAPSVAILACLEKTKLSLEDIDLFEISEAFSAQVILAKNTLKIPEEKLNIFGGDISLGHPLGAAGTRTLVTLLNALQQRKLSKGLACVSYGGGGAIAIIVERVS